MQSPLPSTSHRKAPRSGVKTSGYDTGLMRVYGPVLWLMGWFMRMAVRRIRSEFTFEAAQEPPQKSYNRQLRRARASCLRRAARFMRKWGKPVNPKYYTPRAYAHYAYVAAMPKHWTVAQFRENYARDTGLGRLRVFGLSAAHEITSVLTGTGQYGCLAQLRAVFSALLGTSPLSLAAPADPVPP